MILIHMLSHLNLSDTAGKALTLINIEQFLGTIAEVNIRFTPMIPSLEGSLVAHYDYLH